MLERLQASGRLERYVGVDISADMIAIAEANLRSWLGQAAPIKFHRRDFTVDPLADLRGPATLVFVAGSTLMNFTDPIEVLRHARDAADVIAFMARADTIANRAAFSFGATDTVADIPERFRTMLDRLGVPRDRYEPEFGFDNSTQERYVRIRLTSPVTVANRLTLSAGRKVQLWRHLHRSEEELAAILEAADYAPLTVRRSHNGEFILIAGRSV